jgi:hypothetical protein
MTKLLISSQIRGSPVGLHLALRSMTKSLLSSQSTNLHIVRPQFELWAQHLTSDRRCKWQKIFNWHCEVQVTITPPMLF